MSYVLITVLSELLPGSCLGAHGPAIEEQVEGRTEIQLQVQCTFWFPCVHWGAAAVHPVPPFFQGHPALPAAVLLSPAATFQWWHRYADSPIACEDAG